MALPPDFTLLQVVPELETGGAEQTTIDVARAVIAVGGKALVATRGGRMTARLESDGARLAQMPVQSKNPQSETPAPTPPRFSRTPIAFSTRRTMKRRLARI